jgi:hypothetical protein
MAIITINEGNGNVTIYGGMALIKKSVPTIDNKAGGVALK